MKELQLTINGTPVTDWGKEPKGVEIAKTVSVKISKPIKPFGTRLYFSMQGAFYSGEHRHAERVVRDMGISYESAECYPIGDCWLFYGVTLGNVELPSYIHIVKEEKK